MNEVRNMILSKAICDSLTMHSGGSKYGILTDSWGQYFLIRVDRNNIDYLAHCSSYSELADTALDILMEKIENA